MGAELALQIIGQGLIERTEAPEILPAAGEIGSGGVEPEDLVLGVEELTANPPQQALAALLGQEAGHLHLPMTLVVKVREK